MRLILGASRLRVLNETDASNSRETQPVVASRRARESAWWLQEQPRSDAGADERRGWETGKPRCLARQVRLVGVAYVERERGEVSAAAINRVDEAAEAEYPRQGRWAITDRRLKPPEEMALADVQIARQRPDPLLIDLPRRHSDERIGLAARRRRYESRDDLGRRETAVEVKRAVDFGDVDPQVPYRVKREAESPAAGAREKPDTDHQIAGLTVDELCGRVRPDERGPVAAPPHDVRAPIGYNTELVSGAGHAHP
jgi:hypothetical protein